MPDVVLITGSRDFEGEEPIRRVLETLPGGSLIVEGGARGADAIARRLAREMSLHVATVPALWEQHGRGAGPRRNAAMGLLAPALTCAFAFPLPGGTGTAGMLAILREKRTPVYVWRDGRFTPTYRRQGERR